MDAGIGGNGDEASIILLASLSKDLYPEVITDTFSTKPLLSIVKVILGEPSSRLCLASRGYFLLAVSYTHLTLPTILLV